MDIKNIFATTKAILISSKIINCSYGDYDNLLLYYLKNKKIQYDFLKDLLKKDILWRDFSVIQPQSLNYLLDYVDLNHTDKENVSIGFTALKKGLNEKTDFILAHCSLKAQDLNVLITEAFQVENYSSYQIIIKKILSKSNLNLQDNVSIFISEHHEYQSKPLMLSLLYHLTNNPLIFNQKFSLFETILQHDIIKIENINYLMENWPNFKKRNLYFGYNQLNDEQISMMDNFLEKCKLNFIIENKLENLSNKRVKI